jgi:hypothetical protein
LYYNPNKNKAFNYSDTILFLAKLNGEPVGRIMGIINRKYNQEHSESTARFCHWETIDNVEVANALINAVEE